MSAPRPPTAEMATFVVFAIVVLLAMYGLGTTVDDVIRMAVQS